jgi:hypothetical protein
MLGVDTDCWLNTNESSGPIKAQVKPSEKKSMAHFILISLKPTLQTENVSIKAFLATASNCLVLAGIITCASCCFR